MWAEKVNPDATAHRETEAMSWGKLLEPAIREEFGRRTGIEMHTMNQMVRCLERPFMLASVDGITGPFGEFTGVYEGKTSRYADAWAVGDDGAVSVPIEHMRSRGCTTSPCSGSRSCTSPC